MTDKSPLLSNCQPNQENIEKIQQHKSLCDFCGQAPSLLYCRADSAKLCLNCDRQIHSTNQLFNKHSRSLLCDACDASPSSIFCSTHSFVLCQKCDGEIHSLSVSSAHERRPIEGFSGCLSVAEFLGTFGFDELGKKRKEKCHAFDEDGDEGFENYDGFADYLIWDTPRLVNLDDAIASDGCDHSFQAMGLAASPNKSRNTVCGQRKEDLLCQLREMATSEPNIEDDKKELEHSSRLQSSVYEQNYQELDTSTGFEHKAEPIFFPSYESSAFQWSSDTGEDADQGLSTPSFQSYFNSNCLVPDRDSEVYLSLHDGGDDDHDTKPQVLIVNEAIQISHKIVPHELSSQERDCAIKRYKEKRKSRRYDKHIRYESRKVRAESRNRIKGRFAKVDN